MNNKILSFSLSLLMHITIFYSANAQWTLLPSFTTNHTNLNSVFFTDGHTGYVVADSGRIFKTIDGGDNWILQNSGTGNTLLSVYFPTSNIGYAVGIYGEILKTSNGGSSWIHQSSGNTGTLSSVFFTDAYNGCAVGVDNFTGVSIITTSNGGGSWISHPQSGALLSLKSVFFTSTSTGFAINGYDLIKTIDGGMTWNLITSFHGSSCNTIFFPTPDIGYIIGTGVYKTTNAGINWSIINVTNGGYSLFFTSSNIGYSGKGGGVINKTIDGGINWTPQTAYCDTGTYNAILSIYFPTIDTGYAVGGSGTILKTTNGGINSIQNNLKYNDNKIFIYPNPTNGIFNLETNEMMGNYIVTISDILGKEIYYRAFSNNASQQIDISDQPKGVYFILVQSNGKECRDKVLVIK